MSEEEKEAIRIQFQNALETLINSKLRPTATAIISAEMPITVLFEELVNTIDELQKENAELKEKIKEYEIGMLKE